MVIKKWPIFSTFGLYIKVHFTSLVTSEFHFPANTSRDSGKSKEKTGRSSSSRLDITALSLRGAGWPAYPRPHFVQWGLDLLLPESAS